MTEYVSGQVVYRAYAGFNYNEEEPKIERGSVVRMPDGNLRIAVEKGGICEIDSYWKATPHEALDLVRQWHQKRHDKIIELVDRAARRYGGPIKAGDADVKKISKPKSLFSRLFYKDKEAESVSVVDIMEPHA